MREGRLVEDQSLVPGVEMKVQPSLGLAAAEMGEGLIADDGAIAIARVGRPVSSTAIQEALAGLQDFPRLCDQPNRVLV